MIQLTRLNKELLMVNSDLIKFVERAPDTVITLVGGEKIVVRESADEVLSKIIEFRRNIACGPMSASSDISGEHMATESSASASKQA